MTARISEAVRQQAFEVLHAAGWPDTPIAHVLHAAPCTVQLWREQRQLPRNRRRRQKIDQAEARQMHAEGANDTVIARRFGVLQSAVVHWRQRVGLPPNVPQYPRLTDAEKRKARRMLRLGASRRQVADAVGVRSLGTIQKLRATMRDPGLRRTGLTNLVIRTRIGRDKRITSRIERAVGENLPVDVRSEATAELYLAVLGGEVSADFIEKVAPTYRNRAFEMCGSKFGARSLDEEIGEDGWTLLDSLEDPGALDALEAAAEAAWNDN